MQHVLVHIDAGLGPIGAWGFDDDGLTHFYPESLHQSIPARARQAMAERDLSISVPDWFAFICGHYCNQIDDFETIEVDGAMSLPAVLAEFRRAWSANAESA